MTSHTVASKQMIVMIDQKSSKEARMKKYPDLQNS